MARKWKTFVLCILAATALDRGFGQTGSTAIFQHGATESIIPSGLGVNIHFAEPHAGEMQMLADAGFRWVRMDLYWSVTEFSTGLYDFGPYDRLVAAVAPYNIRIIFILDYSHPLYDGNLSPCTEVGRQAFARWAAAAATHFAGRGILWEMYNEPDLADFWRPAPNVQDYIALALAASQAIRAVAPEESLIGPATSTVDLGFLEACFQAGLLNYWAAVSVHPYRTNAPETVASEYRGLRSLIAKYAPGGRAIPIISGEWGYSSQWTGMNEQQQAVMLARQFLTNLANDIPISIWYDWRDDGADPNNPQHHFGTVRLPYYAGRDPVFDAKPAYQVAQTLTRMLAGYRFDRRIPLGNEDGYALLFSNGQDFRLIVWSCAPGALTVTVPASPGAFRMADHLGAEITPEALNRDGFTVELRNAPGYLIPETPNDLLRLLEVWNRLPQQPVDYAQQP